MKGIESLEAEGIVGRVRWATAPTDATLTEAQQRGVSEIIARATLGRERQQRPGQHTVVRPGGVTALFVGPDHARKNTAAARIAQALGMPLYRIDLARVVNKYIGETEKNLAELFSRAESIGVVLLFDEADALFDKRSDARDTHDRYANLEVAYLLQRMEAYRGLAVLTTNRRRDIDAAFLRRIDHLVEFPWPHPTAGAALGR